MSADAEAPKRYNYTGHDIDPADIARSIVIALDQPRVQIAEMMTLPVNRY